MPTRCWSPGNGPVDPAGDVVLRTGDDETASAHTVSYTTALAVLGRLVATLGGPVAKELNAGLDAGPQLWPTPSLCPDPHRWRLQLRGIEPVLIAGSGVDAPTAEEAALKYKGDHLLVG